MNTLKGLIKEPSNKGPFEGCKTKILEDIRLVQKLATQEKVGGLRLRAKDPVEIGAPPGLELLG